MRDLNKAIIRENHKAQTVKEIAHQLPWALKAFLQVHLTEASSKVLVTNTHKGRYQFKRMPFGAKISQDVFQMEMDLIMEKCPGAISTHNDIVIYGTSDEDHDVNLINLLNVAQFKGLVLLEQQEVGTQAVKSLILQCRVVLKACTPVLRRYKGSQR